MKCVSWFSAGVSSAVATRLAIKAIDQVLYIHIDDQHPDTLRFVRECEAWFGKPITIMQSPYRAVEAAVKHAGGRGWINGTIIARVPRLVRNTAGHTIPFVNSGYWPVASLPSNRM